MEYRLTPPTDEGFVNEEDEYLAMRDYVSNMMESSDPEGVADVILSLANVCEMQALTNGTRQEWYAAAGMLLRECLVALNAPYARPNIKLQNQMLYFPEPKDTV